MSLTKPILHIPNYRKEEIKYTWRVILKEYLGVDYVLKVADGVNQFTIEYKEKSIVFDECFFHKLTTYSAEELPSKKTCISVNVGEKRHDIISLYGDKEIFKNEGNWILKCDIIASIFFMLTRWEESVDKDKDRHGRAKSKNSIAYKFGFLDRPIVNEYTELIWALLKDIGIPNEKQKREFTIVPTHDIDYPFFYYNKAELPLKALMHYVKKRKDTARRQLEVLRMKEDPYDYHDFMMSTAEQNNLKASFFLMAGGTNNLDPRFSINHKKATQLIGKIKQRGHHIGLHPSYDSYNDINSFTMELNSLSKATDTDINSGRQHYLRFDVPETWSIWESQNMEWDSSLGYADDIGFRCGTCYPYTVFDINKQKHYSLIERPLLIMDVTLKNYLGLSPEEALQAIKVIKDQVKKHNGEFVFLWHNSSFQFDDWEGYVPVYESLYIR